MQQEEPNQVEEPDQSEAKEADEEEHVKQGYNVLDVEELYSPGICNMY